MVALFLFLKGMTDALAPFSYLVTLGCELSTAENTLAYLL